MSDSLSLADFLARFPRDTEMDVGTVLEWRTNEQMATCVLKTFPWWRTYDPKAPLDSGRLEIECQGVVGASIRLGWTSDQVNDVYERSDSPLLWRFGQHAALYTAEPLPAPVRFLAELMDVVRFELQAGDDTTLGLFERLSSWTERTGQSGEHQVLTAPEPVAEATKRMLERMGLAATLIRTGRPKSSAKLHLVTIGESWIACERTAVRTSTT